jgi:hypothetical protein
MENIYIVCYSPEQVLLFLIILPKAFHLGAFDYVYNRRTCKYYISAFIHNQPNGHFGFNCSLYYAYTRKKNVALDIKSL